MTQQQPRIPGVRYRKVRRTAWEPVTFNGETKMVKREWTEEVPRLPLNLDVLYVRAAVGVAVFLTCVAVIWSTMAIGRQLGHLVPEHPKVGYLGAAAFELPWVTCLAVAWVLRNQPDRARPVNIAGWIGLGIVVSAIVLDGYRVEAVEVGVLGAFVSVVAKGLWWVVIGLFRVQLDEDRAGWLNAVRQDLAVERVMLAEQQRMSAAETYLAHFGVGPVASARPTLAPPAPVLSAPDPQPPSVPVPSAPSPVTVPAASPVAPFASASAQTPAASVQPSAPAPQPSGVDARAQELMGFGLPVGQPGGAPAPAPSAVPSAPSVQVPALLVPSAPAVPPSAPAPSGPSASAQSAQGPAPSAPDVVPATVAGPASTPAVASAPARPAPDPAPSASDGEKPQQGPAVPIGTPTIASVVRMLTANDPGLRDVERRSELIQLAAERLPEQHRADPEKFAATVKRNLRIKVNKPARRATG